VAPGWYPITLQLRYKATLAVPGPVVLSWWTPLRGPMPTSGDTWRRDG